MSYTRRCSAKTLYVYPKDDDAHLGTSSEASPALIRGSRRGGGAPFVDLQLSGRLKGRV